MLQKFRTGGKHAERQKKTSFPKEQVENTDLYKPVLKLQLLMKLKQE